MALVRFASVVAALSLYIESHAPRSVRHREDAEKYGYGGARQAATPCAKGSLWTHAFGGACRVGFAPVWGRIVAWSLSVSEKFGRRPEGDRCSDTIVTGDGVTFERVVGTLRYDGCCPLSRTFHG